MLCFAILCDLLPMCIVSTHFALCSLRCDAVICFAVLLLCCAFCCAARVLCCFVSLFTPTSNYGNNVIPTRLLCWPWCFIFSFCFHISFRHLFKSSCISGSLSFSFALILIVIVFSSCVSVSNFFVLSCYFMSHFQSFLIWIISYLSSLSHLIHRTYVVF